LTEKREEEIELSKAGERIMARCRWAKLGQFDS
jgi:hypothetical protein